MRMKMDKTTVSFHTFGCRLNQAETAGIERTFENAQFRVVDIAQPADVVVINTCTVTEGGDTDTRRLVNKINRLNPHSRIALIGCQAQVQRDKLLDLPNVFWVVGNAKKMDLAEIVSSTGDESAPQAIVPAIPRGDFTMPVAAIDHRHRRANLKIQDGCDFFCSFCEIPYARGRARSRQFADILTEANALTAAGHQEIILTGINLGTYETDGKKLLDVLTALESIPKLERIRISSIEPTTIPWELFERMKERTKLCRYLHVPLQSGEDEILRDMKRKYTVDEFRTFLQRVRSVVPQICIGTDVIAGFPGETDRHFESTYTFLRDLPLSYIHVFSYSERRFAKSKDHVDPVPAAVIARRSERLRELSLRKRQIFLRSLLGTRQEVLFEELKDGWWVGLTDHYARVKVRSEEDLLNRFKEVLLKELNGQIVEGELLHP